MSKALTYVMSKALTYVIKLKLLLFLPLLLVLPFLNNNPHTYAASVGCSGTQIRAEGLVSTPDLKGDFGTSSGVCVVNDPRASFNPLKLQDFDSLKTIFYTQIKDSPSIVKHDVISRNGTDFDIQLSGQDHIYYIQGNLDINNFNKPADNKTGVVFVEGNLNINSNIDRTTAGNNVGLVFIVKGDINIRRDVDRVNAVLISSASIYTADAGCTKNSAKTKSDNITPISPLKVNGSLISLNPNPPNSIKFCRNLISSLQGNSVAAEQVNHQPKYLVILRELFSTDLQKWAEDKVAPSCANFNNDPILCAPPCSYNYQTGECKE